MSLLTLLMKLTNQPVIIETTNGTIIHGTIINVDEAKNLHLKSVKMAVKDKEPRELPHLTLCAEKIKKYTLSDQLRMSLIMNQFKLKIHTKEQWEEMFDRDGPIDQRGKEGVGRGDSGNIFQVIFEDFGSGDPIDQRGKEGVGRGAQLLKDVGRVDPKTQNDRGGPSRSDLRAQLPKERFRGGDPIYQNDRGGPSGALRAKLLKEGVDRFDPIYQNDRGGPSRSDLRAKLPKERFGRVDPIDQNDRGGPSRSDLRAKLLKEDVGCGDPIYQNDRDGVSRGDPTTQLVKEYVGHGDPTAQLVKEDVSHGDPIDQNGEEISADTCKNILK